jgi:uncharacterized surface protein with fasciclin (FAS1) repeats
MKRFFSKYSLIVLIAFGAVSCDKDKEENEAPTFDSFIKNDASLSMYAKAIDKAQLDIFKNGPGPFTWFVPTNEAFTAALITEDSLNKMTQGQISYILLYHMANTNLSGENMISSNSSPRSSQLGSGGINQFYIGSVNNENFVNGSRIISKDNKVSNGYVHTISRLNVPPSYRGNIANILTTSGQHNLFIQALTRAGLWTSTTLTSTSSVFTVFAPTDAAMTAAGYTSTSIAATTPATLAAVMRYHYILNLRLFTNDLYKGILPSTAAGSNRFLTASEKGTKIKGSNNQNAVNIIKSDILGTNGVVHVIDGVLRP